MRAAPLLLLLTACAPEAQPEAAQEPEPVASTSSEPSLPPPPELASARLTVLVLQRGLDGDPTPVADAFLRWRAHGPEPWGGKQQAIANLAAEGALVDTPTAAGSFEFEVPAQLAIDLAAFADGRNAYAELPALAAEQRHTSVVWLPPPTRRVRGRLLDPGGVALGNMRVDQGDSATTWSDDDGRFSLNVPIGQRSLAITVPGWPVVDLTLPPTGEVEVEVHLVPGGELRLALEDSAGAPAAAWVFGYAVADPARHWTAIGGADGRARLRGLPPDQALRLRVHAPPGPAAQAAPGAPALGDLLLEVQETFVLTSDEVVERTLRLPPRGPIAGRVVDQVGRPLAEVELSLVAPLPGRAPDATYLDRAHLARARTVTDADGRFRFDQVPGGVWLVGVSRGVWNARVPFSGRISPAALPARTGTQDLELRVALGLVLRGTLVDAAGQPPARTLIVARPRGFDGQRETFTHQDGSFELKGMLPGPHDLYLGEVLVRAGVDPTTATAMTLELPR